MPASPLRSMACSVALVLLTAVVVTLARGDDPAATAGRGKSRKQIFEKNGTKGRKIFRHGNFPPHLAYLVNGPDPPQSVIDEFSEIAEREGVKEVQDFVRKTVRQHGLDPHHAGDQLF
jgi:hypothetical protein